MEYSKKIKLLSGIIVLLLVSYIAGTIFSSGNMNKKRASQPIFDKAVINKISAIKIDLQEEGSLLLQKEDQKWSYMYNNKKYPAPADKIENFIDSVFKCTKFQLAGSNSKTWDKFDLIEGKSKDAFFYDSSNNELFSLHIGKKGPTEGSGEYIRTSLSDEVYLIDAPIIRYFLRDRTYWSYLRVLPEDVDSNTIGSVKIKTDDRFSDAQAKINFSMKREYSNNNFEWKDVNGKVIDKNSADMLLNNIASFSADSFSNDHITTDKNAEIEIETDAYGRMIFDIKVLREQNALIGIRGGDYIYESSLYKIERILISVERIIEELK
ncbi:MAG: DUF4340 domain-containing protein [Spirochaetaceae bacterium]|nr:DUF4340 domain-containing protein [Spirochaetaceae bacterium]